jgi:hypothetical protein
MVTYADVQVVATALGRLHLLQHSARSSSHCSSSSQESLAMARIGWRGSLERVMGIENTTGAHRPFEIMTLQA